MSRRRQVPKGARSVGWEAARGAPRPKFTAGVVTRQERMFDRLATIAARRKELDVEQRHAVLAARRAGATWVQIGRYLGVTDEAVRRRYGPRPPSQPGRPQGRGVSPGG